MTAEIALLNKLAVTLAADSAVTIGSGSATKVYNSADKIFEATNHDPIGIMVYNSPELNGVPIESIVKMFRDRTCTVSYPTVFAFAEAFLHHLHDANVPKITIDDNIGRLIIPKLTWVKDLIEESNTEFFRAVGERERDMDLDQLASEQQILLEAEMMRLIAIDDSEWSNGLSEADISSAHTDVITEFIGYVFKDVLLIPTLRDSIARLITLSLLKEYQKASLTGLVFAGFGADEIFPSLVSYEIYGQIAGHLKYEKTQQFDVDRSLVPDAEIFPFAQQDMVDRFIYGLDVEFLDLADRFFAGALTTLKSQLLELLDDSDDRVRYAITPAIDAILKEFNNEIVGNHLARSRNQLADMVRSMPKQELAALCESLVHITSLKRKFSAGAESVGGPIDVAMITRSEGFVWVRRKHYFDPSLNPRYFHRRYSRPPSEPGPTHIVGEK